MTVLIVQSGKHHGKSIPLPETQIVIGRDETCQIRVDSYEVSRHHCSLKTSPGGLVARDLGSRNGTFLNDVRIEKETILNPGDSLRVGPMSFRLSAEAEEKQKSPAGKKNSAPPATDDDIVSWLSSEQAAKDETGFGDTTILEKKPADSATTKDKPKKEFKSIAHEAADIIRRHWEMQAKDE